MADLEKSIAANQPEIHFRFGQASWSLVRIAPGEFVMGTPLNEPGRQDWEMPPQRVRITRPFYLGAHEVTWAQYRAVMRTPANPEQRDDVAVDEITFSGALEFCQRLSKILHVRVTLPTEAQWEYACRAGTSTPYYTGSGTADLERAGWYEANSAGHPHPGGEKQPNAWGLYDVLGNAAEPCIDYISSFAALEDTDPTGQIQADYGAARGGAWMDTADHCRAGYRLRTRDSLRGLGIRIAIIP